MLNTSIAILCRRKKKFKTFCQRDGTRGNSSNTGFLSLSTTDIFGQVPLCWRVVLCVTGHYRLALHQMEPRCNLLFRRKHQNDSCLSPLTWPSKPLPWTLWSSCSRDPAGESPGSRPARSCPSRQSNAPAHSSSQPRSPEKTDHTLWFYQDTF